MNLAELLTIPASIAPDQEIVWQSDRSLTYEAFQQRVAGTASALQRIGVGRGDRVAVLDINSPSILVVLFACAWVSAVFVPLNFRARQHELEHMLGATKPRAVLVGNGYRSAIEAVLDGHTTTRVFDIDALSNVSAGHASAEPAEVGDDELAALLFTSGTTAQAKAVMLAHADLVNYVIGVADVADGDDRGSILVAAPLHHIAGLAAALTATWAGRRIVLLSQFDAGEWLRLVETERITHAFLVPTMLKRVLDHPSFGETDLGTLRVLSYGAAPTPPSVIRRAIESFPPTVQLVNAFGQTETASTVTMLSPEDHRLTGDPIEDEVRLRRLSSIGKPLPDVRIRIVDEQGEPLSSGEIGEITIATNRLMRGYLGQEEVTRATLHDGWLHTRDLGWIDADGYIFLAGRKSDMIIRGGENIAPDEVETILGSHPAVEEAAVIGELDEEWGEVVVAAVVCRYASDSLATELMAYCRERLGRFKAPERIYFLDTLPRNDLGKLLRKDLRQQLVTEGQRGQ